MFLNKKDAREFFSFVRKNIPQNKKTHAERQILNNLIGSHLFNSFETVLCYVSVKDEVNTEFIIDFLLKNGKTVYVPFCKGRNMQFYQLLSPNELVDGIYGIPTVCIENKQPLTDFKNTLCIVPALSFDNSGYRLGYGGGYYDRFFAENDVYKLGIAFECCICDKLPHESFDVPVDVIATERELKIIGKL